MNDAPGGPLEPFLQTPLKLFIADQTLLAQVHNGLARLGFSGITSVKVTPNYFQAMRQLFGEIKRFDGLVLVNHPPQRLKDSGGIAYDDFTFADFYKGVASLDASHRSEAADLLGKCIPIFISPQDSDIRQRTLEDLFPFGIMAAFMLQIQDLHATKEEQIAERTQELQDYLNEFFLQRDHKAAELKEYKSAEDLRQRRAESEKIMAEVEKLKQAKEFDKAIALCRRAAEVLPTDPGAYMEGGKLLVKKKKYPPAMQMFRDAEKVAENLPGPNQEMANLRVAQVKDYVERKTQAGEPVDRQVINKHLAEAVEHFQGALEKAEAITALRSEDQSAKRKDALAGIAENIMTLELGGVVGERDPNVLQLGKLAQSTLEGKLQTEGGIEPKYLVQFGLMAFFEGDLDKAERSLVQAAQNEQTYDEACKKLNYIGTQLRQRNRHDQAIGVYRRLLGLEPSFKGVVLMNLATALATKAVDQKPLDPKGAVLTEMEALVIGVQSLYVDPLLTNDENFYENTAMAPVLAKAVKLFGAALQSARAQAAGPGPSASARDKACFAARQRIDALLAAKKDRDALQMMFSLAQKLPAFFLNFDRHASGDIMAFATKLAPLLAKHDAPKMRTFGKVLNVLVQRGRQAMPGGAGALDKRLQPAMSALERADQADAAKELARALAGAPALIKENALASDQTLGNLTGEIVKKLGGVDFSRFK